MDQTNKLFRFVHLGTINCFYLAKRKPFTNLDAQAYLNFIKESVVAIAGATAAEGSNQNAASLLWPLTTIKKAFNSKTLPRNNEAIIVLSYCVSYIDNKELRTEIYRAVPDLLVAPNDFFMFVDYCSKFHTGKGFGRGLKSAVNKWYNNKTAIVLADMLGKQRQHFKWNHADILRLCRTKFTDEDRKALKEAATMRGCQTVRKYETEENLSHLPGLQRLCNIARLKICENEQDAANMLTVYSLSVDYIPSHFVKSPIIWDAMLSTLNYNELLDYIPFFNDCNLLKPNASIAKKICAAASNTNAIVESKVHPIAIYTCMKFHNEQKRYCEAKKEEYHQKRLKQRKVEKNPFLIKKFTTALNHSFSYFPKTGLRYFITIDIRKSAFKKPVHGLKILTNIEVSVLMALSIFRREKDVTVMAFNTAKELIPLDFKKDMTYEQASNYCLSLSQQNTVHNFDLPLVKAQQLKKKCDIFLTFVDSVIRTVRDTNPPLKAFKDYKKNMNLKQLKYVIFNLSRHTNDFIIDSNNLATKGLLEIAGFNLRVPKLIEAFAKNQFH